MFIVKSVLKTILVILTLVFIWFIALRYLFFDSFEDTLEGIKAFFKTLKVLYDEVAN